MDATPPEFEIRLPLFEGPFDLLLFFIERHEIDIYDIPIAQITDDFLDYLAHLDRLNIEVASEFILVAATLMKIKARMLIPKEAENPEQDPRQELVDYLLEYRQYKSVLEIFANLEHEQLQKETRGNLSEDLHRIAQTQNEDEELHHLDLYRLMRVYEALLFRYEKVKNAPVHQVRPYPYTVQGQKEWLLAKLKGQTRCSFVEIIQEIPDKMAVIFNFLAMLELLQNRFITLWVGEGYNNFWIEATSANP
ncbi:MAG: segregation/condensation protein A [Microscillaceae bacterium]